MAQLLLQSNAHIEARDKYNATPLHVASYRNSVEVAQLLCQSIANIEKRDEDNGTSTEVALSFIS